MRTENERQVLNVACFAFRITAEYIENEMLFKSSGMCLIRNKEGRK